MDLGAARQRVRVARALGSLPRLAEALVRGELSYAKVRALTRVATPEIEERLLVVGRAGTACHVERIVRGWRRVDALAEARETTQRHKSRALHVYQDEDGMVVIRGRLTPEAGAVLMQALAAARETLYQQARSTDTASSAKDVSAETSSMAQQQADALALLAETALHHGIDPGAPGEPIRSSSTSMLPCWRTRRRPASPCSTAARTFPRKRPAASRAMRAGW
jgi:hypothetical protein